LARILAYVTGVVDQELLARNEYLAAENRILKSRSKGRLQLSDAERATLGELGHRLGRKAFAEVAIFGIYVTFSGGGYDNSGPSTTLSEAELSQAECETISFSVGLALNEILKNQ
jgi:hypothetical protein